MTGTVTKTSLRRMLAWRKHLTCSKCRATFPLLADYDQFYEFCPPLQCPVEECGGAQFQEDKSGTSSTDCRDYQEVKVQEQVGSLSLGSIPRSVWVSLEDDLVDKAKPGDDVEVIGVVRRRWRPLGKGPEERTEIELAVQVTAAWGTVDWGCENHCPPLHLI